MSVTILAVAGLPEVRPGDDLGSLLAGPLRDAGARNGDVVAVTQKIVSKAEGRIVPEGPDGRAGWVERESVEVLARREDLVIARTRHGFVCANAGVDASNVEPGFLTLLPEDPDGSAETIRTAIKAGLGLDVAVVITDTFGRAWRRGVVNVAIGCAGLPSLVDLRGTTDHTGRILEATVVALADEIAAATGLVMGKSARLPVAIVRGVDASAPVVPAAELIRPPEEDLFRASPLEATRSRHQAEAFGPGEVPESVIAEAIATALTATDLPLRFTAAISPPGRRAVVAASGPASRSVVASAPALIVMAVRLEPHRRDEVLVRAGAVLERLAQAAHAQGYATAWLQVASDAMRDVLGLDAGWSALGIAAVGPEPGEAHAPHPAADPRRSLTFL